MHSVRFSLVLFFVLLFSQNARSQVIDHWESVVNYNDVWRYFVGSAEPDAAWAQTNYNAGAWPQGPGGVGLGDGDDNTVIPQATSVYVRRTFNIIDTADIMMALFEIDFDDGFIAYLNDVEIARSNLGAMEGDRPPFWQLANSGHEAVMYQGGSPSPFIIPKAKLLQCLVPGNNVLAITVHNATFTSSDLSCIAWLHVGVDTSAMLYNPVRPGFTPPMESSNLPIVWINTHGVDVPDEPRVQADLGVIWNGPGNRNYLGQPFNHFSGPISIETRGSSSAGFPKQSFNFETQDSLGENYNFPMLGMPEQNDWILYAPYTDKAMMRNTLPYYLFREMGHYTTRTQFCEVIINGQYVGVYEMMEKIKFCEERVDAPPTDADDFAGDSLTGAYLWKLDKTTAGGIIAWYSPYNGNVGFQFHEPEYDETNALHRWFLENDLTTFEQTLMGPNFSSQTAGYRNHIDVLSWIDFLLVNELGHNVDGYRLSSYFMRQRDSYGGRHFAGPLWDFNLAFGNADYCDGGDSTGWAYNTSVVCPGGFEVPFWWTRLLSDNAFANQVRCRWNSMRSGILSDSSMIAWVDTMASLLNESQVRNYNRWQILGQYVWPNNYIGLTYQDEVNYFKSWLLSRMDWMDANLPAGNGTCGTPNAGDIVITEINYNSIDTADAGDWIELYNAGSSTVNLSHWRVKDSNDLNVFTMPYNTTIAPGAYLVVCQDAARFTARHPLVTNYVAAFGWDYSNGGESIRLYDGDYVAVREMTFDDDTPWPPLADGAGFTLEVVDPTGDLSSPLNWTTGCVEGSPGGPFVPCPVSVEESFEQAGLQVAPNPFSSVLSVWIPEGSGASEIHLKEITGKTVLVQQVKGAGKTELITAGLSPGVYLLEVFAAGEKVGVKKVVKI